jgi:hypothetical protein
VTACTREPISWLRLEQFALGAADPAIATDIAAHLADCPACRDCLDRIRGDAMVLPPLAAPRAAGRRARRRWWLAPALAAATAAAVAVAVVVLRPAPAAEGRVAIKGVGEVALELVRERAGAISYDARRYAPGDRWKVVISCPPAAAPGPIMAIDVSVADGATVDHPLAEARIACGNRVVVPGAFTVTGDRVNRVCARIAAVAGPDPEAATACVALSPDVR